MKTISIVDKLLFFETNDLYTLDTKIGKSILNSYEIRKLSEYANKESIINLE